MPALSKARVVFATGILLGLMAALSLLLSSCGTADEPTGDGGDGKYIHQTLATDEVGANEYISSPPGQSTILEREYPGAPPLIPHSLDGLAITKDGNSCLTCHVDGLSLGPGHTATAIPESHYIDPVSGSRSEDIQAMRYNCLLCHVPQTTATPPL
jgi:cytochrome c-type protein NapB